MSIPIEGYMLLGNTGESFEYIVQNGFMKAREYIWFTSAKTTDFMIPNPRTKEAMQFSQRLYQLARRGIKIRFILSPKEAEKNFYQKLKDVENIEFRFCYDMHMKIVLIDSPENDCFHYNSNFFAVDQFLELFSGFEERYPFCRDLDSFPCFGVTSCLGFSLLD